MELFSVLLLRFDSVREKDRSLDGMALEPMVYFVVTSHEKSQVSSVFTASIYSLRIVEPFSCSERQAPTFHAFSTARFSSFSFVRARS